MSLAQAIAEADAAIDQYKASGKSDPNEAQAIVTEIASKHGYTLDQLRGGRVGMGDYVREIAAGVAFEGADEIEAGFRSGFGFFEDESYDEILNQIARERRAFQKRNPFTAGALNVGGALGTAYLTLPNLAFAAARPLATSILGGLAGGASTEVMTRGSGEKFSSAPMLGAGLGAVGGAAGYGIGRAAQAFVNRGDNAADMVIAERLANDGVSPSDVKNQIGKNVAADQAAGVPTLEILADYGGESTRRGLRGARVYDAKSQKIKDTLETRQRGSQFNASQEVLMQSQRVARDIQNTMDTAYGDAATIVRGLQASHFRNPVVGPLYKNAYSEFTRIKDPNLIKMIADDANLSKAYTDILAEETSKLKAVLNEFDKGTPEHQEAFYALVALGARYPSNPKKMLDGDKLNGEFDMGFSLEFLDQIKRREGNAIFDNEGMIQARTGGKRDESRRDVLKSFRNRLVGQAGGEAGNYGQALKISADAFEIGDAMAASKQIMNMPLDKARAAFNEYKPMQQDAIRLQFMDTLLDSIRKAPSGTNAAAKVSDTAKAKDQLQIIFEGKDEAFTNFMSRIQRESEMFQTRSTAVGGSNTADKAADATNIALRGLAAGNVERAKIAFDALSNMQGPKSAEALANRLLDQNPASQRATMDRLNRLQETLDLQRRNVGRAGFGSGLLGGQASE